MPKLAIANPDPDKFQSAPGLEAGRCVGQARGAGDHWGFNPRPALRPGDAAPSMSFARGLNSFNPRPALRPGDANVMRQLGQALQVSIRARP